MKAGRDMDALVAEKVMGHGSRYNFTPSTSIEAAWQVVERVGPVGNWTWKFGQDDDGLWWVELKSGYCSSYKQVFVEMKIQTLPLAICLAALKAVGYPIE